MSNQKVEVELAVCIDIESKKYMFWLYADLTSNVLMSFVW